MNHLSVNLILKSVIGLLTAAVVAFLASGAWSSWNDARMANRIVSVAEATTHMFNVLGNMRVDRSNSVRDLNTEGVVATPNTQALAARAAEMPAYRKAIDVLSTIDFPDQARVVAGLETGYKRLTALHAESLAALAQPKSARRAGLADEFFKETSNTIDTLSSVSAMIAKEIKLQDSMVDKLFDVKSIVWVARAAAGDASVSVSGSLNAGKAAPDMMNKLLGFQAQAAASWASMKEVVAGLSLPPAFEQAVAAADRDYFAKEVTDAHVKTLGALIAGENPGMTSAQWSNFAVPKLSAIMAVAERALDAAQDIAEAQRAQARTALFLQVGLLIAGLVFAGGMMWLVSRRVTSPLAVLKDRMTQLSNGDLTVDAPYTDRGDEIGALGKTMQTFKENMVEAERLRGQQAEQEKHMAEQRKRDMHALADQFDKAVGGVVDMVASAATELQSAAQTLTATAEQTSAQSSSVAAASEEASSNVASVASATEELSSSVGEISRQVAQSAAIASKAVTEANQTNERVKGLAAAADKIGSIVGLINEIAGKTNLLALNATIEAARAGDAGKGFAVVAAEVKQLADQTAKATAEISAQIGAIQDATGNAALAIEGIGRTIETMNEIASTISVAVDGQGAATGEIARNVQEASRGTAMVSQNITGVTAAASESSAASSQVLSSASELSHQAEVLRAEVGKFLSTVRAA